MAIEPTFTSPEKNRKIGSPEQAQMIAQDKSTDKTAKKKRKSRRNRHTGASLGWGWFQGFNLFITLYFLIGFLVFGYFMMGGENHHDGLPKYVLDRADSESGKVVFNPQIPETVRQSYIYAPPVKVPTVNNEELESLVKQKKESIELIGEEKGTGEIEIELISDEEDNLPKEVIAYRADELIEMATLAKSVGNYVGTNQQDAYYFYQQALVVDPANSDAKNGIDEIAYIYYQNADRAIFEGDYQKADQYIRVGLIVDPNNIGLMDLQRELEFLIRDSSQDY